MDDTRGSQARRPRPRSRTRAASACAPTVDSSSSSSSSGTPIARLRSYWRRASTSESTSYLHEHRTHRLVVTRRASALLQKWPRAFEALCRAGAAERAGAAFPGKLKRGGAQRVGSVAGEGTKAKAAEEERRTRGPRGRTPRWRAGCPGFCRGVCAARPRGMPDSRTGSGAAYALAVLVPPLSGRRPAREGLRLSTPRDEQCETFVFFFSARA